jgi:hypothetical protein
MKTTFLVQALALAAVIAACSSSNSTSPSDSGTQTCPAFPTTTACSSATPPTYTADVAPILHQRCSPCHLSGGIADKIVDLSTYENVDDAATAILNEISMCDMPPIHGNSEFGIPAGTVPGLDDEQVVTIHDWFYCGERM